MTVKVILQLYPMLPAKNEEERRARRPIGRDAELYHEVVHGMTDIVKAADALGFWGLTEIEHHFHSEGYEVNPSPGILNAYWASQVKQLRMGQLGYVMGAQHPIRVAEETAMLDHLTHGKFFVGFARGYQSRWTDIIGQHYNARAAIPPADLDAEAEAQRQEDDERNRRVFEDQIDLVLKAWTQDLVRHKSEFFQVPYPYESGVRGYPAAETAAEFGAPGEVGPDGEIRGVSVVPAPYQKPHPPVFISSSASMETVTYAAERGFNVGYFTDIAKLKERAEHYQQVARSVGVNVPLGKNQANFRWFHAANSAEEYDEKLKAYDVEIFKNFISKFFPRSHFRPPPTEEGWVQTLKDSGLWIGCGSVDDQKRAFVREWEEVPAEYLMFIWHYAQQPKELVIREMEIFMEEIYPEIKDAYVDP